MASLAVLVSGSILVPAAPADAATTMSAPFDIMVITAAIGVDNVIAVTTSGSDLLVTDYADVVTPGPGCESVSAHTARCPAKQSSSSR